MTLSIVAVLLCRVLFMLSVVVPSVTYKPFILSVIVLSVVMLSVVTPETVNKIKNLTKKTERNSNVVTLFIIQKFQKHL